MKKKMYSFRLDESLVKKARGKKINIRAEIEKRLAELVRIEQCGVCGSKLMK